eukprot:3123482-Prymnesium_polylepis.3
MVAYYAVCMGIPPLIRTAPRPLPFPSLLIELCLGAAAICTTMVVIMVNAEAEYRNSTIDDAKLQKLR